MLTLCVWVPVGVTPTPALKVLIWSLKRLPGGYAAHRFHCPSKWDALPSRMLTVSSDAAAAMGQCGWVRLLVPASNTHVMAVAGM